MTKIDCTPACMIISCPAPSRVASDIASSDHHGDLPDPGAEQQHEQIADRDPDGDADRDLEAAPQPVPEGDPQAQQGRHRREERRLGGRARPGRATRRGRGDRALSDHEPAVAPPIKPDAAPTARLRSRGALAEVESAQLDPVQHRPARPDAVVHPPMIANPRPADCLPWFRQTGSPCLHRSASPYGARTSTRTPSATEPRWPSAIPRACTAPSPPVFASSLGDRGRGPYRHPGPARARTDRRGPRQHRRAHLVGARHPRGRLRRGRRPGPPARARRDGAAGPALGALLQDLQAADGHHLLAGLARLRRHRTGLDGRPGAPDRRRACRSRS